jgi:hypothetical protein
MRILATAIVIAIAAMSAGCSGSSSSSSRAPAEPVPQTTTTAPTQAAAGPTAAASGSIHRGKAVPAHLVGRQLDVAEGMLHAAHISYKVIPLHGRVSGAASQWGVCDTTSVNMSESSPVVNLIVARLKCGGH